MKHYNKDNGKIGSLIERASDPFIQMHFSPFIKRAVPLQI